MTVGQSLACSAFHTLTSSNRAEFARIRLHQLSTPAECGHGDHRGDVAKAIHWVHDHIAEHGGDPERLLIMGHPAGVQLAALICTDDRYLKAEDLSLAITKGCVPVDGDTYDVPAIIETAETRWRVHGLTGRGGEADARLAWVCGAPGCARSTAPAPAKRPDLSTWAGKGSMH